MNDENTVVEPTVEPTETEETTETTADTTETTDDSSSSIDYDAIAQEEEARKPDPIRAKIAYKEREAKRQTDDTDDGDDDTPVTRKDLQAIVERTQIETRKALTETTATELARSLASSDAEARAILATWRNRSFPDSMTLSRQMEEMHAAVNYKRFSAERNEANRALKNRAQVTQNAAGTHRDPMQKDMPKMSEADKKGLQGAGYKWDGAQGLWKKTLPGGKHMFVKDLATPGWIA